MSDDLTRDELRLRRNLLFRILKDFDFDQPVYRYEAVSAAVADWTADETRDVFIFTFAA
jgi:hypothetical protein